MIFRIVTKMPKSDLHYIQKPKFPTREAAQKFIDDFKSTGNMVEGEIAFVAEEG